jgi:hypothetical protein
MSRRLASYGVRSKSGVRTKAAVAELDFVTSILFDRV